MSPSQDPSAAKILLVDDRPENLIALEAILEPLGHGLVRASSGEEALRHVLVHDFAVLLLDVQMPGMNGFELAQLIKSRERSRHTPIIFLTAISKDEAYVFEGYSAGAVDYMFKPFNPTVLRSKVSVFVELYLRGTEIQRQSELLRDSERRELELEHRTRLLESEARYAEIVDSAMDAILTFGDDRKITLFNAAAERMFQRSEEEVLTKSVDALFRTPLPTDAATATRSVENGAQAPVSGPSGSGVGETMGIRRVGEDFPVEFSLSCLRIHEERLYTAILRDVSERRRAEAELQAQALSLAQTTDQLRVANEELSRRQIELERAMGARSRFYASMSHELRTPINAILGYTSLLLDNIYGPLNEKQVTSIDRTYKAAQHLLDLVNDVLDLSKIEAGKMELLLETVGFPELIQDLFVTVAPLAEQYQVELMLENGSAAASIVSDARRVRQILLNLFSNAIKFGDAKPVRVRWEELEDGGILVEVIDQGGGIATEDQEKIFDEFVQLDQAHREQGTGLGLPISRRLAELLGGTLGVESAPGAGSLFRLTLPPSIMPELSRPRGPKEPALSGT